MLKVFSFLTLLVSLECSPLSSELAAIERTISSHRISNSIKNLSNSLQNIETQKSSLLQKLSKEETKLQNLLKRKLLLSPARERLLGQFRSMAAPAETRKLQLILKSQGLNIKKLPSSQLRYLISKTRTLLDHYKKREIRANSESPIARKLRRGAERELGVSGREVTQLGKFLERSSPFGYEPNKPKRKLTEVEVFNPMDNTSGEDISFSSMTGGSMVIKFPDSPPVINVTQQPFYSYI